MSRYVSYVSGKKEFEDFFAAIDHDGSGTLTQDELQRYLSGIGERMRHGTLFQETIIVPGYLCAVASLIGSAPPACAPCHQH